MARRISSDTNRRISSEVDDSFGVKSGKSVFRASQESKIENSPRRTEITGVEFLQRCEKVKAICKDIQDRFESEEKGSGINSQLIAESLIQLNQVELELNFLNNTNYTREAVNLTALSGAKNELEGLKKFALLLADTLKNTEKNVISQNHET